MESEIFTQHISRKYNAELENLRTQVSNMGGLVERQLALGPHRDRGFPGGRKSA